MKVTGLPLEKMLDPKIMALLREHRVVYLHGSPEGWIVERHPTPSIDPTAPETITLTLTAAGTTSGALLTDVEIAELRALIAHVRIPEVQATTRELMLAGGASRLLDDHDRARALLKRIEWSANDGFECPACGEYNTHTVGKPPPPHKPDCELAALIGGR